MRDFYMLDLSFWPKEAQLSAPYFASWLFKKNQISISLFVDKLGWMKDHSYHVDAHRPEADNRNFIFDCHKLATGETGRKYASVLWQFVSMLEIINQTALSGAFTWIH